jgi:AcrR family transcriptional regulator
MPKVVPEYKEEAKSRILETATEMFLENGFKKTKMTEIARRLGVSKGALYQYYSSKDELLMEVMKDGAQFRRSSVFSNMKLGELPQLASKKYFDKMIQSTAQIDKLGVEIASLALHNPELMKGVRGFYLDEVNIVQEFFEKAKKGGIIKPDVDTRVIAVSILSFRSGLRGFMNTAENPKTIYSTWKQQVELLLKEILA